MTRGTYGPLDRDRHFVASWGTDHAVSYGAARALRPIAPALEVVSSLRRGVGGARNAWLGSQSFQDRGEPSLAHVGTELFHSVSDRQRAVAQLTADFQALAADLTGAIAASRDPAAAQWLAVDVLPAITEWHEFAGREQSWLTRAATSWEALEDWYDRLRRLRELARAHGIVLASPEPAALPSTVWEKGAEGKGGPAAWLGLAKIAVAGAIGILGFVTLYTVLRDLHAKVAVPR